MQHYQPTSKYKYIMFKENKYTKVYYAIIKRANIRHIEGYVEKHHIIPKCLGGNDEKSNLAALTAREHFICHRLLTKMVDITFRHKLVYAAWQLCRSSKHKHLKITSRTYETLRTELSATYTGVKRKPFSDEWRANMSKRAIGDRNNMYGKKHRVESIEKMSINRKGKCSGEDNPFFGKTHSRSTVDKIIQTNQRIHTCPHCGKSGASNSMKRWHFDNCKFKR